MANYHFNTSYGHMSKSSAHASYILAENKYSYKENEIMFSDSKLPSWAKSSNEFWEAVSYYERINARGYREFRFSLPNELPVEENINLVNEFIKNTLNDNFYYTVAIHNKEVDSFEKTTQNIHCHLMFNERKIDGIERDKKQFFKRADSKNPHLGGTKKSTEFNKKEKLLELRKDMEILVNFYYEKNGFEERVSCESLETLKEKAIKENDTLKIELYDREPIHINGRILKLSDEQRSKKDKLKYEYHLLNIEKKNLKEIIYEIKLENMRQSALEKALDIDANVNLKPEPINVFDKYISNEKDIASIEKEITKNLDNLHNIELKTLFKLDKESYNVFRSKELLEKELFVMENSKIRSETFYIERGDLENKIFKYEQALDISIAELKENNFDIFESTKESLTKEFKDNINSLEINKLNFQNENKVYAEEYNKVTNDSDENYFEKNIDLNLKEYLNSVNDLRKLEANIKRTEQQLEPNRLNQTAYNKLTNGEYGKLLAKHSLCVKEIESCTLRLNTKNPEKIKYYTELKEFKEATLKEIVKEATLVKNSVDKNKLEDLKHSLEVKLNEKLIYLNDKKPNFENIVHVKKSDFINTDISKDFLINKAKEFTDLKNIKEQKIHNCNGIIARLDSYYSNEKIVELTQNRATKGQTIKLTREYDKLDKELETLKDKINNANMLSKIGLNKEKTKLESHMQELNQEYKNVIKNISKEDYNMALDSILNSKEKALHSVDKISNSFKEELKEISSNLKTVNTLKNELYPYKGLESKYQNINFNKLMDHSKTGGGGQERIESFFDELEREKIKNKSRDFEL